MNRRWVSSLGVAAVLVISLVTARTIDLGDPAPGAVMSTQGSQILGAAFSGTPTVALPVEQVDKSNPSPHKSRGLSGAELLAVLLALASILVAPRWSTIASQAGALAARAGRAHPGRGPPVTV